MCKLVFTILSPWFNPRLKSQQEYGFSFRFFFNVYFSALSLRIFLHFWHIFSKVFCTLQRLMIEFLVVFALYFLSVTTRVPHNKQLDNVCANYRIADISLSTCTCT